MCPPEGHRFGPQNGPQNDPKRSSKWGPFLDPFLVPYLALLGRLFIFWDPLLVRKQIQATVGSKEFSLFGSLFGSLFQGNHIEIPKNREHF